MNDGLPKPLAMARRAVAALCIALVAQCALGAPRPADEAFDRAVDLYEQQHWDAAFTALAELADRGHPVAARMALKMQRYGVAAYGTAFAVEPARAERWARRAARPEGR